MAVVLSIQPLFTVVAMDNNIESWSSLVELRSSNLLRFYNFSWKCGMVQFPFAEIALASFFADSTCIAQKSILLSILSNLSLQIFTVGPYIELYTIMKLHHFPAESCLRLPSIQAFAHLRLYFHFISNFER